MREPACNLVTGVLAVILCGVCLKIRQYVSKLDSLSQSQTFWLTDCLDTRLNTALPAPTSWHVPWFFHFHKPASALDDFGRLRPVRFPTATGLKRLSWPVWASQQSALLETGPFGSHCATVLCLPGLLVLVLDGPQCFAASATYWSICKNPTFY